MRVLTVGGTLLKAGSSVLSGDVIELADITTWAHLYDAKNITTYAADDSGYSLSNATRVDQLASSTSSLHFVRDQGLRGDIFSGAPIPGPLFISSSDRFNGRPAWFSDTIVYDAGFFDNIHSGIFQDPSQNDNATNVMGLTQPWSAACLIRTPNDTTGNELMGLDGNLGSVTISGHLASETPPGNTWDMSAWHSLSESGSFIRSDHANSNDRTFLLISIVNGASSRFLTCYRDSSGALQVSDKSGTVNDGRNDPPSQQHIGWSYTNYGTFIGFKQGAFTDTEILRLIQWSAQYMPAEALIPLETS